MRKTLTQMAIILCMLIIAGLSSCRKTEEPKESTKPAVVLSDKVALWEATDETHVKNVSLARIGDEVQSFFTVSKDSSGTEILTPEKKAAIRSSDNQEREFYHIKLDDGKEYWIQDLFLAPSARPAVITGDDVVLYSKPDMASPTSQLIPKYTIVGVHDYNLSSDYWCISAYLDGMRTPVVTEKYVKKEAVNTSLTDARAMRMYKIAMDTSTQEVVKKELLGNASKISSAFRDLIETELAKYAKVELPIFTINDVDIYEAIISDIDGANINVRNAPGLANTVVVTQISDGTIVDINGRTAETDTIDGVTTHWYRVVEPAGWIFGAYIAQ
ncbi:SH3 domain-containing protein [Brucepastera parasyntrophica]|uniref:SH3 domain-containing protein n=1 Tax=Brucepastera parasyntrophica TaxID=2880008 RepID=UPI00210C8977|nr:SH3 domain-containing protein [Brucepastera parasyntrophica]ULQ59681.1 SH3 domain-containing protein [Brucepastera parasyntrophica]